jgi:glutamate-1-semialdehyde 2,1-aminomutase/spore coat polysaccharide biosynthesis protein SpsF
MRTTAIIQARMSSTRLPGKVMKKLGELTVLEWCTRAAKAIPGVDTVAIATSKDISDDPIVSWCEDKNITCIRGPLQDVLARYALAARETNAEIVLRLTSDCPLLDPILCGEVLALLHSTHSDYASNVVPRIWPDGTDCEAFTAEALYQADAHAALSDEREHVTPFLRKHPERFKVSALTCPISGLGNERWTLDTVQDFAFLSALVPYLSPDKPPRYTDVLAVLKQHPELTTP